MKGQGVLKENGAAIALPEVRCPGSDPMLRGNLSFLECIVNNKIALKAWIYPYQVQESLTADISLLCIQPDAEYS